MMLLDDFVHSGKTLATTEQLFDVAELSLLSQCNNRSSQHRDVAPVYRPIGDLRQLVGHQY